MSDVDDRVTEGTRWAEVLRRWATTDEPWSGRPPTSSQYAGMVTTCLASVATHADDAALGAVTRALLAELDRLRDGEVTP